jgi:hypothetical protein
MILPSKHLQQDRALLTVGGQVLALLSRPRTVSALWEAMNSGRDTHGVVSTRQISYDWFVLALDLLYSLGTIELENGLIARRTA